ncbi:hypothetical protein [Aquisphaera insulae]|uniref:hypothetical protein n=1 Tax=Aquisphaera insulae TaxID=2712864 RepID=UPI0013ED62E6|nr:hypothetical protein [Aquisphaera insulae]
MARRTVGLALTIPILALFGAAFLVIGPGIDAVPTQSPSSGGETVIVTVFPLILAAFDPIVWISIGNSLAVAAAVALVSLVVGVAFGEVLGRRSAPGEAAWPSLVLGPAVIAPGFLCLGLIGVLGDPGFADRPGRFSWSWLLWAWSAVVPGVALVAWAVRSLRRTLDPALEDAARLAGAGPLRAWWNASWPLIRPIAGGVAGFLFTATLADPGPALILNLRRTIAFQLVVSARGRSPFPRSAALGLLILAMATAGLLLFRLWGRASRATPPRGEGTPPLRREPRGLLKACLIGILLASWCCLAWAPVAGLLILFTDGIRDVGPASMLSRSTVAILGRSCGLAFLLAAVSALASPSSPRMHDAPDSKRPGRRRTSLLGGIPSLVIGIGVLSIARVASMAAVWADRSGGRSVVGSVLGGVSWLLDPAAVPGLLVVIGGCADMLRRGRDADVDPGGSSSDGTSRAHQAEVAGAGRGRANRLARAGSARSASRIALLSTIGATSISPAILLATLPESQPLGPAVLVLAGLPGGDRFRAAALALIAVAACLLALAWAAWPGPRSRVSTHEHLIG